MEWTRAARHTVWGIITIPNLSFPIIGCWSRDPISCSLVLLLFFITPRKNSNHSKGETTWFLCCCLFVFCQTRWLSPDPNTDHIWWMLMCDIWISNIHLGLLFCCLDCVALQWVILTPWCHSRVSNSFINPLEQFSCSSSMFIILILKH